MWYKLEDMNLGAPTPSRFDSHLRSLHSLQYQCFRSESLAQFTYMSQNLQHKLFFLTYFLLCSGLHELYFIKI